MYCRLLGSETVGEGGGKLARHNACAHAVGGERASQCSVDDLFIDKSPQIIAELKILFAKSDKDQFDWNRGGGGLRSRLPVGYGKAGCVAIRNRIWLNECMRKKRESAATCGESAEHQNNNAPYGGRAHGRRG